MTSQKRSVTSYQELYIFLNSLGDFKKVLAIGEESSIWLEVLRNENNNLDIYHTKNFENFHEVDVEERFDLTICLNFKSGKNRSIDLRRIKAISDVSNLIVFSSPSPFRPNLEEIKHWPSYWSQIFEESFFFTSTYGRSLLWENKFISPNLIQELIVCSRNVPAHKSDVPLDVIHPQVISTIKYEKAGKRFPKSVNKVILNYTSTWFAKFLKRFLPLKLRKKIKVWLLS